MSGDSNFRLAIRADASSAIGTGHVFRCLALADELRRRGNDVVFICADAPGKLDGLVRDNGCQLRLVPDGLDPEADAVATISSLAGDGEFDWLLVDHYGLDARFERKMRSRVRRVAALDDLANRPHDVDLLCDYSHDSIDTGIYDGLVPSNAQLALGQSFTLLRREFFERKPPRRNFDEVRRILVTLGGNDPLNATGLALDALNDGTFSGIEVDLTVGVSNPRLEQLRAQASRMANVTVHVQSSRMVELMADADLCLGAGGMTSWERCYMGLPSLILILADNQCEIAEKLHKASIARNLGSPSLLGVHGLRSSLQEAISNSDWRRRSSRLMQSTIDGQGVFRVIEMLDSVGFQR